MPASRFSLSILTLSLTVALLAGCEPEIPAEADLLAQLPETVDFNYHIKPLLSDRCYACHGPDVNARKADLRLDTEEGALQTRLESGGRAVRPGSLRRSQVFRRIYHDDPEEMMPPQESNLTLSDYEKALIARWIDQGAEWQPHWAYTPPGRPDVPEQPSPWVQNPIDHFVLTRLEREGLEPSPEADRERLLRRVTLDLTGLPPTLEEIDAFLADDSPGAYEAVVDRLLASEAYGERMALDWMDVARYADSHGYHADGYRMMWPWRDWVIGAFNANMPFDRFITWQLAGDLLPNATREQKLATAFHRNHPMTAEGGIVDEEYRLEYVFDRTNTTAQAFLGLTMECARCHDHKFDPISQKEYYQFAAFFNNVNELGMTADDGNTGPTLLLPEADVEAQIAALKQQIAEQEWALAARAAEVRTEGAFDKTLRPLTRPPDGLIAHYPLETFGDEKTPNTANPGNPAKVSGEPELVPGPVGSALKLDYDYDYLELNDVGRFEHTEPFSAGLWVYPETSGAYAELFGNAGQKNSYWRGYEVFLDSLNHVSTRLIHALPHNYIRVTTREPIPLREWTHVMLTYDGSSTAAGVSLYLNGERAPVKVDFDQLYKTMLPVDARYEPQDRPLRVGRSFRAFGGDDGIFTGSVDDIRVYDRRLTAAEVARLLDTDPLGDALALAPAERTGVQTDLLLEHYLLRHDDAYRAGLRALAETCAEWSAVLKDVPELMVMKEMDEPRPTYMLDRGLYDAPLERVFPGTPAAVGAFPDSLPPNRLGLAQWLTDPRHPLTARVTVNRYWQLYFGAGLVRTPQDFGSQGSLPTHPALLDWLAGTFVESGWDVKGLQKLIVMSATYRQSSKASPDLLARDPENHLLARGPSYRLPAELIRDNALAASGLLVRKLGGPSAKPYQPEGLWIEKGSFSPMLLRYVPDTGEGLYRRGLYTFIKRTSPPPSMAVFDAPDRSQCIVRRQATTTPLQALVLLNDPQYVEAARMLAERMLKEGGDSLDERLMFAFRLLTGRRLTPAETDLFAQLYEDERTHFRQKPERAAELLNVGEHPRDERLDPTETAALTVVASMMINHDEAYTKR